MYILSDNSHPLIAAANDQATLYRKIIEDNTRFCDSYELKVNKDKVSLYTYCEDILDNEILEFAVVKFSELSLEQLVHLFRTNRTLEDLRNIFNHRKFKFIQGKNQEISFEEEFVYQYVLTEEECRNFALDFYNAYC